MNAINLANYIDICSYCELMTSSIQKSIETGDYDGAHVQLSVYLLEIHGRYLGGEIDLNTWKETIRFYRRMTTTVIEESNLYNQIQQIERED